MLFCSVKDIGKKSSCSELFKLTELLWATWDQPCGGRLVADHEDLANAKYRCL